MLNVRGMISQLQRQVDNRKMVAENGENTFWPCELYAIFCAPTGFQEV